MPHLPRRWMPQFRLRSFLLGCVLFGVSMGWLSANYHRYQIEQQFILKLASQTDSNAVFSVQRNDHLQFIVGRPFS